MAEARILVVEDERITAEDIKDGLESLGYIVPAVVSSGEDAIKKAKELQPDLVLMDIRLEGEMDGIEAAEKIRTHCGVPVIYLTAYSDENTVERAKITEPSGYILKEPFGFIHKPFEESELHTLIEITLYKSKIEKRLRDHERWLSTILKSISDAVVATDYRGRIKFMNPVAENLTGWIKEDAIGKDLMEILVTVGEEPQKLSEIGLNRALMKKIVSKGPLEHFILVSKDGTKIPIDGFITPLEDDSGNINGLVVVFRDIQE